MANATDPSASSAPNPPGDHPAYRNRNRGAMKVPASSIRVNPKNWRGHPEYQRSALEKTLARIGFVGTLVVWEPEPGIYELIDGELRSTLMADGLVDVMVADLTQEEADELLAVHDQIGSLANPRADRLSDLLKGLKGGGTPLEDMGWPEWKLEQVLTPGYNPTPFVPNTTPTATPGSVTPAEVAKAGAAETAKMAAAPKIKPVICPHCAKEFMVDPASLVDKGTDK